MGHGPESETCPQTASLYTLPTAPKGTRGTEQSYDHLPALGSLSSSYVRRHCSYSRVSTVPVVSAVIISANVIESMKHHSQNSDPGLMDSRGSCSLPSLCHHSQEESKHFVLQVRQVSILLPAPYLPLPRYTIPLKLNCMFVMSVLQNACSLSCSLCVLL